jgi:hypothetical protein
MSAVVFLWYSLYYLLLCKTTLYTLDEYQDNLTHVISDNMLKMDLNPAIDSISPG